MIADDVRKVVLQAILPLIKAMLHCSTPQRYPRFARKWDIDYRRSMVAL